MPDNADAPTQTENTQMENDDPDDDSEAPDDDPRDDRPRRTPAYTAVQALRAMLGSPPGEERC